MKTVSVWLMSIGGLALAYYAATILVVRIWRDQVAARDLLAQNFLDIPTMGGFLFLSGVVLFVGDEVRKVLRSIELAVSGSQNAMGGVADKPVSGPDTQAGSGLVAKLANGANASDDEALANLRTLNAWLSAKPKLGETDPSR